LCVGFDIYILSEHQKLARSLRRRSGIRKPLILII
jgi:hypothetical protein